jgi:5-deoxy-D-glucuronate isomerase
MYNTTSGTPSQNTKLCSLPVTGTITATQNSQAIVGVGTTFFNQVNPGDVINIAGVEYSVLAVIDNLNLTIAKSYVATTASGLTITKTESQAVGAGAKRYVQILSRDTNTGVLYIGESKNPSKDGTDITATVRSQAIGIGQSIFIFASDLRNFYIQSPVASQAYSINIF